MVLRRSTTKITRDVNPGIKRDKICWVWREFCLFRKIPVNPRHPAFGFVVFFADYLRQWLKSRGNKTFKQSGRAGLLNGKEATECRGALHLVIFEDTYFSTNITGALHLFLRNCMIHRKKSFATIRQISGFPKNIYANFRENEDLMNQGIGILP